MILAALHAVDKHYGGQTVLEAATLELRPASRTALVGRNGAGKTTVLRLLAGLEPPDGGAVFVRDEVEIGVLAQDPAFRAGETVLEVCARAFAPLEALEAALRELETAGLEDPERFGRWETLHERFERRGGYERRARRDAVLHALGFRGRGEEPAHHLSGGERTRLGLARLLMAQPDVLLLDEPTNHLDIEMRAWLEGFLGRAASAALIVSHDRAFLDGACDRTAEVSRGRLRTAEGPPSAARAAWEEQDRIDARTRANQEKELARLEAAAAQMKQWAGQNEKLHRRARSMERRAERYAGDLVAAPQGPERSTRFRFDAEPSGEIVLQAEHLTKAYERPLFRDVGVTVRAGERIALVGPNGAGKTTLLRVLLGEEPSDDPRARLRFGARVRVGYYDQQLAGVDESRTLFEEVVRLVGDVEAHNLLGRFLFPYDAQFKRIADLSGGERARLALLKLSLGGYNLLVLDEPTNHLDVEMIEALEAALAAFEGTLLMVSHDRRFLDAIADRVWDLRDGRLERTLGGWRPYERKRREAAAAAAAERDEARAAEQAAPAVAARRGPSSWQLERERERLEAEIAGLEASLAEAAERLARPDALPPDEIAALGAAHAEREAAMLAAMGRWEEIEAELEARRADAG